MKSKRNGFLIVKIQNYVYITTMMHAPMITPCHSANFKVTESLLKVNKIVK